MELTGLDGRKSDVAISYDPHPLSRFYTWDALEKYGLQIVEQPHREMQTSSLQGQFCEVIECQDLPMNPG